MIPSPAQSDRIIYVCPQKPDNTPERRSMLVLRLLREVQGRLPDFL